MMMAQRGDEAARSANTPADRSKRATQLSPGAALPALCLLGSAGSGPFGKCRTRIGLFGVRDGEEDWCRTRIGLFGVRDGEEDWCRTWNGLFGIRDGEEDGCRTRNAWFGVRDRAKVMCECKPLSTVMYNWCCLRLCGVPGGVRFRTPEHVRLY
jgi:hypothetical protein